MNGNIVLLKHPQNWGLDEDLVVRLANEALNKKKLQGIELSVVFVGRKKAKELNIKYRQKSYVPQVLGFPLSLVRDADGMVHLGDIVICTQKLKYESKFQQKLVGLILKEWVVHGLENLLI